MRRDKQLRLETEGHDERHAMVAALSMHLPEYGPDGGEESTGLCRTVLSADGCRAVTTLSAEGRTVTGAAEWTEELAFVLPAGTEDDLSRRRRWLVGTSVYRAACAFTGARPPWGSLSGVRPAKVAGRMLRRGMSRADADIALRQVYELNGEKARMVLDAAEERERTAASLRPGESALYVGIPFCPTVCRYCSFVNRAATPERLETYMNALQAEIAALGRGASRAGYELRSVYVGGGTPTVLSERQLYDLFACLAEAVDLSCTEDLTVEAGRPDTLTEEKLRILKDAGANRVCVNTQTLDDEVLRHIGRRHTAEDYRRAFALARRAGPFQINTDLIAGLPGETREGFRQGLSQVIGLGPEQITVHSLALKNASAMTEEGQSLSPELHAMLSDASELLYAAGYRPYYLYRQKYSGGGENVGWMRDGAVNRYNILMMEELCPVLAVGAGGVSKILRPGGLYRLYDPKYPDEYEMRIGDLCREKETLPPPMGTGA